MTQKSSGRVPRRKVLVTVATVAFMAAWVAFFPFPEDTPSSSVPVASTGAPVAS